MAYFQVNKKQEIEGYVLRTMTGDIVSFTPSYSEPLPEPFSNLHVKCELTPSLDGYTAVNLTRCGVNLWDEDTELGTFQGGNLVASTTRIRNKYPIPVKPSTTYRLIKPSDTVYIMQIDKSSDWTQYSSSAISGTFTTESWCNYLYISPDTTYGTTYNNDISINYPATDTQYHAYTGKLIKLEFDDTVYLAEVSCLNGVWKLKSLGAEVDLGDLTYTRWTDDSAYYIFYAPLTNKKNAEDNTGLCSYFTLLSANATSASNAKTRLSANNTACLSKNTITSCIYLRADQYTTTEALVAALSGQKLIYELATPTEITLDETEQFEALLGVNNVWHDGNGNTEVTCLI